MQRFPDRPDELPTINRIVFTGDVFRVAQDEQEPSQLCNVFWLHNLVSYQLAQLTGIIPEICFRTRDSRIGYSLIRNAYKVLGLDASVNGWRSSFWYEDVPDDLVKLFRPDYENALVFAFELSPIMECILNRLACCWVDIAVSPIRFLDDLLLSVRLSSHFKSEPLLPFVVSEKDIKDAADFVSRWFRSKRCESDLKADDVVFFAQTEGDRTLITGKGNFFPVEETIAALAEVVGERRLWIKPHPYALKNRVIQRITERLGGRLIEENVYAMLSADVDINVVTIASSVGREAPWFGKRTKLFYDRVLCRTEEGLTIGDSYCFSDFWTALLKQIMPVTSLQRAGRLDVRHQALRQTGLKPNSLILESNSAFGGCRMTSGPGMQHGRQGMCPPPTRSRRNLPRCATRRAGGSRRRCARSRAPIAPRSARNGVCGRQRNACVTPVTAFAIAQPLLLPAHRSRNEVMTLIGQRLAPRLIDVAGEKEPRQGKCVPKLGGRRRP